MFVDQRGTRRSIDVEVVGRPHVLTNTVPFCRVSRRGQPFSFSLKTQIFVKKKTPALAFSDLFHKGLSSDRVFFGRHHGLT